MYHVTPSYTPDQIDQEIESVEQEIGTLSSQVDNLSTNINSLSTALANKITIQTLDNVTINSGYFTINYPSGITYNSHYVLIYQRYASGHTPGYIFTIQPQSNLSYVYTRNPVYTNGMPPDGSKVSVTVVYIRAS